MDDVHRDDDSTIRPAVRKPSLDQRGVYPFELPFEVRPISEIPGAELSPGRAAVLRDQLRAIDEAQSRALVEGSNHTVT